MRRKEMLFAAVIGGIVGAVLAMVGVVVLPLGAQSNSEKFGEIVCTGLKVIDLDGKKRITVDPVMGIIVDDPAMGIFVTQGEGVAAAMSVKKHGGLVDVYGKDGNSRVTMGIEEGGGFFNVYYGKDWKSKVATVGTNEHGGTVQVSNRLGKEVGVMGVYRNRGVVTVLGEGGTEHALNTGMATMRVDEDGGDITVHRRESTGEGVRIDTDEHGGQVVVFGKGNKLSRAIMGVDEFGNGGVSVWDKNGYRSGSLD